MKKFTSVLVSLSCLIGTLSFSQIEENLPRNITENEKLLMESYLQSFDDRGISTPPPFSNLRTAAEWEEVQALVVTWTGSYNTIHRQIIAAAQLECEVIVMCTDSNAVKSNLASNSVPDLNISFIEIGYNSVWIRDYGANSVYVDDVDSLILVDWIYNRPRPLDDVIPDAYAAYLGIDIYPLLSLLLLLPLLLLQEFLLLLLLSLLSFLSILFSYRPITVPSSSSVSYS